MNPPNPNLAQLVAAAAKLEPLLDQIAFVGGGVTGLLLTDLAVASVRPTLDVDAIIAIASYAEFTQLENRMRQLGFREYLSDEFKALLSNHRFLDALPGHLLPDAASQQRIGLVMARMRQLVEK